MNIQYILIALTCLMLSIDSAAMRRRSSGGMRAAGAGRTLQQTRPTTKTTFKPHGKQDWNHKNQWHRAGYKRGYNPWHRPNYWRRPVYAPTYVGVGYPDYYATSYTDGYTSSSETLSSNPQETT